MHRGFISAFIVPTKYNPPFSDFLMYICIQNILHFLKYWSQLIIDFLKITIKKINDPIFGFWIQTVRFKSVMIYLKWSAHIPNNESEFQSDLERHIRIRRFWSKTQKLGYSVGSGPKDRWVLGFGGSLCKLVFRPIRACILDNGILRHGQLRIEGERHSGVSWV